MAKQTKGRRVESAATVEHVRAGPADQRVLPVARAAPQDIVADVEPGRFGQRSQSFLGNRGFGHVGASRRRR